MVHHPAQHSQSWGDYLYAHIGGIVFCVVPLCIIATLIVHRLIRDPEGLREDFKENFTLRNFIGGMRLPFRIAFFGSLVIVALLAWLAVLQYQAGKL